MPKKKNILLIAPTCDERMADETLMSPCLGIVRIAGYLKSGGHYAEYIDLNLEYFIKTFTFEEKLKEREWDIIGFSTLEETLIADIQHMNIAKQFCPDALIVAGGQEAQFNFQTFLNKSPARIVVLGEGEIPMLMLANEVSMEKIPGIVVKNEAIPLTNEEYWDATKAIDWENIPYEKYWDYYVEKYGDALNKQSDLEIHTARIFSKNRCPYGCNYCTSTNQLTWAADKQGVQIVGVTADNIISIIERIIQSHPRVKTIYFTDDDFCVIPKELIVFCKKVVEKNFNVTFMCLARMTDLNEQSIKWMAKAKFRNLNMGVETFSDKILKDISKKCTTDVIHQNIKYLQQYNIDLYMNILIVTPESTLEDIEETIYWVAYYMQNENINAGINPWVCPLKGSNYYEMYADYATRVERIPNTNHYIKRELMIYVKDPYIRELQERLFNEMDEATKLKREEQGIIHATATNMAMIDLEYIRDIIQEIRVKYNLGQSKFFDKMDFIDVPEPSAHHQHFCSFHDNS
jgi:radical SAM superfamily enzyme YgiQ (UPF0313 family)|tara:strand:- start:150 stop:1703 length:1554 start_codon:yes stop_codon:yes gene_type:complete